MSDNKHAAMCVYCGDSIIYDTREVTDMAAAHAQIVEHDQQCPKNPLVARIAELEEREQALAAYIDRLSRAIEACMPDDERKFVFTPDDYTELESALEAKFSDSLVSRDEESMRKGFWWGFERARMHPDENNILAQWEDVKALKRRNESVRQERAQQ